MGSLREVEYERANDQENAEMKRERDREMINEGEKVPQGAFRHNKIL